tara:strand:+ start:898 stop:1164 length:267 start_codon:yes stop_codon:yes gene_type:complete
MTKPIPKWVQERVSKLWKEFGNKEVTYKEIEDKLTLDDKNTISAFLRELNRAGWIETKLSEDDMRKRLYKIKEPNLILREMVINNNEN